MRPVPYLFLAAVLIAVAYLVLPNTSRDATREAIDSKGYFSAFYSINRALEEYVPRHFNNVPDSIEVLLNTQMPELGGGGAYRGEPISEIVGRCILKPLYRDPKGLEHAWLLAVLVPRGTVDRREYVYYSFGDSEFAAWQSTRCARVEAFAEEFGQPLLDELRRQSTSPASLSIVSMERPKRLGGHQGSWPDDSGPPWWCIVATPRVASTAPTSKQTTCEGRKLTSFLRPLTFARDAWAVASTKEGLVDSQACRLALRVPCNGGAGDDTVRLSLASLRNSIMTVALDIDKQNRAKTLYLSLTDSAGRIARWDYDLPPSGQPSLKPRGNATLSTPNVPPADSTPLDLGHIVRWEVHGEQTGSELLSVSIWGITMEGPRDISGR